MVVNELDGMILDSYREESSFRFEPVEEIAMKFEGRR
jgi:hypothetical protein